MKKLAIAILLLLALQSPALAQEAETAGTAAPYNQQAQAGDTEVSLADAFLETGKQYYYGYGIDPDYKLAEAWFLEAAKWGNAEAQCYLGLMMEDAQEFFGEEENQYEQAAYWYTQAAEQGYEKAQLNLGYLYCEERYKNYDYAEAAVWFSKAAAQGNPLAQYALGYMHRNGCGVEKDYDQADAWYLKAAEEGFLYAEQELSYTYNEQRGMMWLEIAARDGAFWAQFVLGEDYDSEDYEKALYWFARSAEQGHYTARCAFMTDCEEYYGISLGDIYAVKNYLLHRHPYLQAQDARMEEDGDIDIILQNSENVFSIFRIEAEAGDSDAQMYLGLMYEYGVGVAQDYVLACNWYQKAVDKGNRRAMICLGGMAQYGKGIAQDDAQALEWYQKAVTPEWAWHRVDLYDFNADAIECLGAFYAYKAGQDSMSAAAWYQQAAEQGDAVAMRYLAILYDRGNHGVEADREQATYWIGRAAECGDACAQYLLGTKYERGIGVEKDVAQALGWYLKAAEQNYALAMCEIGDLYRNGKALGQPDYEQAMIWYRKAAEAGNQQAMLNIAEMHRYGDGVAVNFTQAMNWYRKAKIRDHYVAEYEIGHMYRYGMGVEQDLLQAIDWFTAAGVNDDFACNELYPLLWMNRELD